jgi:hypothetical protein
MIRIEELQRHVLRVPGNSSNTDSVIPDPGDRYGTVRSMTMIIHRIGHAGDRV